MLAGIAGILALVVVSILGSKGDVAAFSKAIKEMKE